MNTKRTDRNVVTSFIAVAVGSIGLLSRDFNLFNAGGGCRLAILLVFTNPHQKRHDRQCRQHADSIATTTDACETYRLLLHAESAIKKGKTIR